MPSRTDSTQAGIVAALRAVGCGVVDLHRVGGSCPDLVVSYRGRTLLMEVKSEVGSLRPGQRKFIATWQDRVPVVRCVDDALRAIGIDVTTP